MEFIYRDRGYTRILALVPGWATDYRIFDKLDLPFNYLLAPRAVTVDFEKQFLSAMKFYKINKLSLLGYSLGGFLATQFAFCHRELIDDLILVSVRRRYTQKELKPIEEFLKKDKHECLVTFYKSCCSDITSLRWFKTKLLKEYCQEFELDFLMDGLQYLGKTKITAELLCKVSKITIIHGECDNIAPFHEARMLADEVVGTRFINVKGAGHMPFFYPNFSL